MQCVVSYYAATDTRPACRVRRDIMHRGRDVLQVLDQYERTVKPSFESYILPTKKYADIIVSDGMHARVCAKHSFRMSTC